MSSQEFWIVSKAQRMLHARPRGWQAAAHTRDLIQQHPRMGAGLRAVQLAKMAELAYDYADYVSTVSNPGMAVSLETAGLLAAIYERLSPGSVVDLGSGFSTYVACRYAVGADIVSVDDNLMWLAATGDFLARQGVERGELKLLELDDFQSSPTDGDVVFHDLGRMCVREQTLQFALQRAEPGGVVVLDDLHKYDYWRTVASTTAKRGQLYPLRQWTTDHLGRYSGIWVAPETA